MNKMIILTEKDFQLLISNCINSAFTQIHFSLKAPPEYFNINQAAEFLNLAKSTIYTLVSKQLLPHKKVSRKLYFSRVDLIEWLEKGNKKQKD